MIHVATAFMLVSGSKLTSNIAITRTPVSVRNSPRKIGVAGKVRATRLALRLFAGANILK